MNRLIMPIGLPRSGKSSWTRKQECPIVCVDCIRLALHGQPYLATAEPTVWSTAKLMVNSLFLAGHDRVILDDAINVRAADREGWRSEHWVRGMFFSIHPRRSALKELSEMTSGDFYPSLNGCPPNLKYQRSTLDQHEYQA